MFRNAKRASMRVIRNHLHTARLGILESYSGGGAVMLGDRLDESEDRDVTQVHLGVVHGGCDLDACLCGTLLELRDDSEFTPQLRTELSSGDGLVLDALLLRDTEEAATDQTVVAAHDQLGEVGISKLHGETESLRHAVNHAVGQKCNLVLGVARLRSIRIAHDTPFRVMCRNTQQDAKWIYISINTIESQYL